MALGSAREISIRVRDALLLLEQQEAGQPETLIEELEAEASASLRTVQGLIDAMARQRRLYIANGMREAIANLGVEGLTVSEVKGFGRQKGHTELYRGAEYQVDFLPKVKLEIATADENVEGVIEAICKAAYTGKIGDGKIFVYDLLQAVRIRTGESDDEAL
jgi:nitrogen regulatory protein P-II 2